MQTNKCIYCGSVQGHSVHSCANCGGQVQKLILPDPFRLNKKTIYACLVSLIIIGPFIYQYHINNTATAIFDKLQTGSGVTNPPIENALFAKVMSSSNIFKVSIVEYYHSSGHYPKSLSEIGVDGESFTLGPIDAIKLSNTGSGQLRIKLASRFFGKKKYIILTPIESMGGMSIEWICASNLDHHLIDKSCKSDI